MTKRVTSPFSIWVDGSPRVYPGGMLIDDPQSRQQTLGTRIGFMPLRHPHPLRIN